MSVVSNLLAVRAEIGRIKKDGLNPYAKANYATLENILAHVNPILEKHNTLIDIEFKNHPTKDEWLQATVKIWDTKKDDAMIERVFDVPMDSLQKNAIQSYGATLTYSQRYIYGVILGIAFGEDDPDAQPVQRPGQNNTAQNKNTPPRNGNSNQKQPANTKPPAPKRPMAPAALRNYFKDKLAAAKHVPMDRKGIEVFKTAVTMFMPVTAQQRIVCDNLFGGKKLKDLSAPEAELFQKWIGFDGGKLNQDAAYLNEWGPTKAALEEFANLLAESGYREEPMDAVYGSLVGGANGN